MNRKKYKISSEDFKNFEQRYLIGLLVTENPMRFGQAFLTEYEKIVEEYIDRGGDFGLEEATKLWNESDIEKAKLIIKNWVE